ncbi:MAG: hypothetical protein ACI841_005119 [Planctomycetota bacterium]
MSADLARASRETIGTSELTPLLQVETPFVYVGSGFQASNREQDLQSWFLRGGVRLHSSTLSASDAVQLRLAGLARSDMMRTLPRVAPKLNHARV